MVLKKIKIKKERDCLFLSRTEINFFFFFLCLSFIIGAVLYFTINFDILKTVLISFTILFFCFLSGYLIIRKLNIDKEDILVYSISISFFLITISILFNSFVLKLKPNILILGLIILAIDFAFLLFTKSFKFNRTNNQTQQLIHVNFKKIPLYSTLLFLIFFFHVINNIIITYNDNAYPGGGDAFVYLGQIALTDTPRDLLKGSFTPPLYLASGYPIYLTLGTSKFTYMFINLLFLYILLFSVFKIGCVIRSESFGLLSALIVSFFPLIFALSRVSGYEFGLLSAIFLTIYSLLKTNYFKSTLYSALFGVSLALSAGIKPSFAIYLSGPILLYLIYTIKNKSKKSKDSLIKNIVLAFSLAVISISIIYLPNISSILNHLSAAVSDKYSETNYWFYFSLLPPFFLYLFIASFAHLIIKGIKLVLIFLICTMPPLVILTFVFKNNLTPRFGVHVLPFFAFIIAAGFISIKNKIIKHILTLLLIIGLLFQFYLLCYSPYTDDFHLFKTKSLNYMYAHPYNFGTLFERHNGGFYSPSQYDYEFNTIKRIIQPYIRPERNSIFIQPEPLQQYIPSVLIFGNLTKNFYRSTSKNPSEIDFIFLSDNNLSNVFINMPYRDLAMFRAIGNFSLKCYDGPLNVYVYAKTNQ